MVEYSMDFSWLITFLIFPELRHLFGLQKLSMCKTLIVLPPEPPTSVSSSLQLMDEQGEVWGRSWAMEGGSGLLDCRVKASPQPTFNWTTADGEFIANSEKYSLHYPQVSASLMYERPS